MSILSTLSAAWAIQEAENKLLDDPETETIRVIEDIVNAVSTVATTLKGVPPEDLRSLESVIIDFADDTDTNVCRLYRRGMLTKQRQVKYYEGLREYRGECLRLIKNFSRTEVNARRDGVSIE